MACVMQVAQFSAEMERYEPAIQIYEDVAHRSMDNNLLKFSAKGYLLNAGICRLCGQYPAAPQLLRAGSSLKPCSSECGWIQTEPLHTGLLLTAIPVSSSPAKYTPSVQWGMRWS